MKIHTLKDGLKTLKYLGYKELTSIEVEIIGEKWDFTYENFYKTSKEKALIETLESLYLGVLSAYMPSKDSSSTIEKFREFEEKVKESKLEEKLKDGTFDKILKKIKIKHAKN